MKIDAVLNEYLDENKHIKGLSETTIKCQKYVIGEYCRSMHLNDVEDITRQTTQKYIDKLKAKRLSNVSVRSYLGPIMTFLSHHYKLGIIKFNPSYYVQNIRSYRTNKIPLKAEDMRKLLNTRRFHVVRPEFQHKRNRAIIGLLIYTGMRVGEIAKLTLNDVYASSGYLRVNNGKYNIDRIIPISGPLQIWLKEYEKIRLRCKSNYYFIGLHYKTKMHGNTITNIIKSYARTAKIRRNVCGHILRYSFASQMLKGGVDMEMLRIIMGHKDMEMTAMYAKPDPVMIRDALLKNPLIEYFGGKT